MRIQFPNGCIELTREQLEQAHNEYVELMKEENAMDAFKEFVCSFFLKYSETPMTYESLRRYEKFRHFYGFYPEEGTDPNSPHYVIGRIYADHEQKREWYEDYEQAWHDAVETVMDEVEDTRTLPVDQFLQHLNNEYALDVNCFRLIEAAIQYASENCGTDNDLREVLRQLIGSVIEDSDISRVVMSF